MKKILYALSVCLLAVASIAKPVDLNTASAADRAAWLDEAKFGLFIHWGLYSELGAGEWVMFHQKPPVAEYEKLAATFNPVKFDADEWVRIAKDAGMKYITITSKHHDGFAMFKSEASDYNIVDATPFKRDVVQELADACKREGIKLGLYYSHVQDWRHPGGAVHRNQTEWDPAQHGDFQTYLDTIAFPQVKEIVTQYNPAIVWFDTPFKMTPELGHRFVDQIRSIHPDTLVNSRLMYHGFQVDSLKPDQLDELRDIGVDYLSYRDRTIPEDSPWEYWETCMTLNNSWGYRESDHAWKTPGKVLQQLVEIVSKGGTFLLNVGPTAEGVIPQESVAILKEVGRWLEVNGETIYGAQPTSLTGRGDFSIETLAAIEEQERIAGQTGAAKLKKIEPDFVYDWLATGKDGKVYIHLFKWPGTSFEIEGFKGDVTRAYLLRAPDTTLTTTRVGNSLKVELPAAPGFDELATVLCLETPAALSELSDQQPNPKGQARSAMRARLAKAIEAGTVLNAPVEGSIVLKAADATLQPSSGMHEYMGGRADCIGRWKSPDATIEWTVTVEKAGTYDVTGALGAAKPTALTLSFGTDQTTECSIPSTGDYKVYGTIELGSVTVTEPGEYRLLLTPVKKGWRPVNVRSVTLSPVE